MAEIDKTQVIQQIVQLQKDYAEATKSLDFYFGPAKREQPAQSPLWRTIEVLRQRQDLIDKRLRYIEKFVLSG